MTVFADQTGRTISLAQPPRRIVSLVPSQTELLFHLGLEEEVAGITKFCIHPSSWHQHKTKIGGTKNINLPRIRSLNPDLILASKEENVKEQIESLWNDIPVWVSDVKDLDTALKMIADVGQITGREDKARSYVSEISLCFAPLQTHSIFLRAAYLIWREPYMTVGADTFIHYIMTQAGFENVFAMQQRYPVVNADQLRNAACDVVFLSSEPYPFKQKHLEELQSLLPNTLIMLVDGELFSWYGSRLLHTPVYLQHLRKQVEHGLLL